LLQIQPTVLFSADQQAADSAVVEVGVQFGSMPMRIQCSACALIERLSALLEMRRFSCMSSEIFTMPTANIRYEMYMLRILTKPSAELQIDWLRPGNG
jgi:hypothetical protein